jgi:hypothetical protein
MEWLSADIEAYFSRGLQRRLQLIGQAMATMQSIGMEWVTIHFRRNIPIDVEALAVQSGMLKGILSDETILTLFPADIVPSVQQELERIESQRTYTLPESVDE